jgi:hypothetical protein
MMHHMDVILQITVNWNKVFVMCSKVKAGNFVALIYSILLIVSKSVLKVENGIDFMEK